MTTSLAQIKSHIAEETTDRRRGGRPSLPVEERRVERVTVPFSLKELQRVFEMARAVSVPAATFIRAAALRVQVRRPVVPDEYRAAWAALSRTAGNINQLTSRVNFSMALGEVPERNLIVELHNSALPQILHEIQDLRRVLLKVSDDQ